jgi:hypothetical protein
MRIDTDGNVIQWYIPTHPDGLPDYNNDMIDVVLTAEQDFFWAKDGGTGALYKFNVETGEQTNFHVAELITGTTVQMQIYLPGGFIPPNPTELRYIRRLRQAPHIHQEHEWMYHHRFQLDLETGIGLESGQGVDPQVMLQWSDDGGYTWSNEYWVSAGTMGEQDVRALWYRLGRSRNRLYRVIVSDPVKWAFIDAFLRLRPGHS